MWRKNRLISDLITAPRFGKIKVGEKFGCIFENEKRKLDLKIGKKWKNLKVLRLHLPPGLELTMVETEALAVPDVSRGVQLQLQLQI